MRRIAIIAAFAILASIAPAPAPAQTAEDAFGVWRNPENGSHIEMYDCGGTLCARIVKVQDGQKTDDKNPDTAARSRPIIGLLIISGAKKSGPNTWQGTVYNRADGGTYAATLTVKSRAALDLKGCAAKIYCKTVTWGRVN